MKLKKQFADFYREIKIDEEVEDLKEKREVLQGDIENKLPNELKKHGIDLKKSEIKIFDQGSYKLNTTISNDYGSIDRDVAVMFPLNIVENSDPRKITQSLFPYVRYTHRLRIYNKTERKVVPVKTRAELYGHEATELLRIISMYPGLSEKQLCRFYPGREDVTRNLLSHLCRQGRTRQADTGGYFPYGNGKAETDPGMGTA